MTIKMHADTENTHLALKYIYHDDVAEMTADYNETFNETLSVYTVRNFAFGRAAERSANSGPPEQFVRFVRLLLKTRLRK